MALQSGLTEEGVEAPRNELKKSPSTPDGSWAAVLAIGVKKGGRDKKMRILQR